MKIVFFLGMAYLLGSIPFGWLVVRGIKGMDIRKHGSGNIGATNVLRAAGKQWGIFVFLLDALKGALAVLLPALIFNEKPAPPFLVAFGMTAILGHSFPVWLGFKGGKGVATSLGVFLALVPVAALTTFLLWLLVFLATRILSVASLTAAFFFPIILFFSSRHLEIFHWVFPVSFILMAFIFFTHRGNIQRLVRREEKKLF